MKTSIAQQNKYFIPKAAMPRIWWEILAAVHQMTEDRIQGTYPNQVKMVVDQGICCPSVSEGAMS